MIGEKYNRTFFKWSLKLAGFPPKIDFPILAVSNIFGVVQ
jgi:hypothetical protein